MESVQEQLQKKRFTVNEWKMNHCVFGKIIYLTVFWPRSNNNIVC